jgi:hypothetical protein
MKLPAVAIASDFASGIAIGLWPVVGNRACRGETHGKMDQAPQLHIHDCCCARDDLVSSRSATPAWSFELNVLDVGPQIRGSDKFNETAAATG